MIPDVDRFSGKEKFDLSEKFCNFLQNLKPKIDYIIVCGDIADKARIEEYELFDTFIGMVINATGLSTRRLLFTPGNHDVDWKILGDASVEKESVTPKRLLARYDAIRKSDMLSESLAQSDNKNGLFASPFFTAWSTPDLFALSINTAAHDSHDVKNHPGAIEDVTFDNLHRYLIEKKIKIDTRTKLLLIHHHPIQYPNVISDWKDFSILQSREEVLGFASSYGFDLIAHGHRHQPHFKSSLGDDGLQISVLGCGSFSQGFPTFVYEKLSNQFHILDCEGRDSTSGILFGALRNYSYSAFDGWQPSNAKEDGIAHELRFGPNFHKANIESKLEETIISEVNNNGKCILRDIDITVPEFQYSNSSLLMEYTQEIAKKNKLLVFGEAFENSIVLRDD